MPLKLIGSEDTNPIATGYFSTYPGSEKEGRNSRKRFSRFEVLCVGKNLFSFKIRAQILKIMKKIKSKKSARQGKTQKWEETSL